MVLVLHALHVLLLVGGAAVVAALLIGSNRPRRRIAELRAAARNGGLVAAAEQRARAGSDARRPWLVALALADVAAGVVHGAVCPEHFTEGWRFGVFFLLLALAQLAAAALAATGRVRLAVRATVLVSGGALALWALTRTVGLPFGLAGVEPVGVADLVASAAEVAGAAVAVVLLRLRRGTRSPRPLLAGSPGRGY